MSFNRLMGLVERIWFRSLHISSCVLYSRLAVCRDSSCYIARDFLQSQTITHLLQLVLTDT